MDSRKIVFRETATVVVGELICVGAMLGVFSLLKMWGRPVWLGALIGTLVAILNFLFMAIGTSLAADRAAAGNVKGGQGLLTASLFLRYVVMIVVFFAAAKSGYCNVLALLLPMVFVRPVLTIGEFFRKKGDLANGKY